MVTFVVFNISRIGFKEGRMPFLEPKKRTNFLLKTSILHIERVSKKDFKVP